MTQNISNSKYFLEMLMFCLCWNASFKISVSTDVLWRELAKLVFNEKKKSKIEKCGREHAKYVNHYHFKCRQYVSIHAHVNC